MSSILDLLDAVLIVPRERERGDVSECVRERDESSLVKDANGSNHGQNSVQVHTARDVQHSRGETEWRHLPVRVVHPEVITR
jgi:hypothetical protein